MAIQYEVRSASLLGLPAEVEKLGGDLPALLGDARITPAQLADPDCLLQLDAVIRVLSLAAQRLNCDNLGMRVAEHQDVLALGLLGRLIAAEPNLGAGFDAIQRYMALHNKAEHWRMQRHNGRAYIRRIEHFYGRPHAQQYRELALRTYARLSLEVGGADARPLRVEISHSRIAPLKTYQQHFGCEVLFDQEHDCLVYDDKLMDYPVQPISGMAAAQIDSYMRKRLSKLEDSLELQVRSLITQSLGLGQHSLETVAAQLGLHPRVLQRRLNAQGLSYLQLLLEVKMQLACWHLEASTLDITLLADALGYTGVAAFSKAFKKHQGVSPSQWRKHRRQVL
ncbi:MAG: AraC family transcriptional regulator [Pseudomonas sp.]